MVVKSSLEKTLTNSDDLADRPHRIRTYAPLIKGQRHRVPPLHLFETFLKISAQRLDKIN
jgi:hypothetical protein